MTVPATGGGGDDGSLPADGSPVELGNEFARVQVSVVRTRNGVRLELASPKLGYRLHLDPVELEALTWQTHGLFSTLLARPLGPEPDEPGT